MAGVYCGQCRTAMTNALRLSAGVAGLAKVGVVNCEEEEAQELCYQRAKLPAPPHAPQVRIFRSGAKDAASAPGYMGEVLYNANEMQPHVALRLAELVARNALNDQLPPQALASAGGPSASCGDRREALSSAAAAVNGRALSALLGYIHLLPPWLACSSPANSSPAPHHHAPASFPISNRLPHLQPSACT